MVNRTFLACFPAHAKRRAKQLLACAEGFHISAYKGEM